MREELCRGQEESRFSLNHALTVPGQVGICRRRRHFGVDLGRDCSRGIALCRQKVAPPAGIEPATPGLGNLRVWSW